MVYKTTTTVLTKFSKNNICTQSFSGVIIISHSKVLKIAPLRVNLQIVILKNLSTVCIVFLILPLASDWICL